MDNNKQSMKTMFQSARLGKVVAAILLFLGVLASVAYATHSWGGYHWARTSSPFTLKLVDSVTTGWNSYLGTTSADWSASTALDTAVVSGNDSDSTRKRCPAVLGKDRVCNAAYGNNGWLGIAQIWVYSSGHIAQGVVKLNDTYFNTSQYNTPAWRKFVMCQEVGHTLGLDHQDEIFNNANLGTCMDYTNDPSGTLANPDQLNNEHPNTHDYDMLLDAIMYGHLDSTNTTTSSSDGGGKGRPAIVGQDIDLNDPSAWGRVVRKSSNGRTVLYERDLGNREKVFTFVIWADQDTAE